MEKTQSFESVEESAAGGALPGLPPQLQLSSSKSPQGITGDKLTSAVESVTQKLVSSLKSRLDWINLTFPVERRLEVQRYVEGWFGAGEERDRGIHSYSKSIAWQSGTILAWGEARPEAWLSINGDSCDLIPSELKPALFRSLFDLGAKFTRLDCALDCPRWLLNMDLIHKAAEQGQVDGFRRTEGHRPVKNMNTGELEGDQRNFGRRGRDGSGKFHRAYDKGLESGGEIDCVRLETEFSGGFAHNNARLLAACGDLESFEALLAQFVISSIDFTDKSKAYGHRDRFQRLPWYQKIYECLGSFRLTCARVKPNLESTVVWAKNVMPKFLARLESVIGYDSARSFVEDLFQRGRDRLDQTGNIFPLDKLLDLKVLRVFPHESGMAIRPAFAFRQWSDDDIPPF